VQDFAQIARKPNPVDVAKNKEKLQGDLQAIAAKQALEKARL